MIVAYLHPSLHRRHLRQDEIIRFMDQENVT